MGASETSDGAVVMNTFYGEHILWRTHKQQSHHKNKTQTQTQFRKITTKKKNQVSADEDESMMLMDKRDVRTSLCAQ
jgi:hypothetical protein